LNQQEELINTDFVNHCNNDHVISNSGQWLAVSHQTHEDGKSRIYTLPITGEKPVLITPLGPSYLHGWSPDENTLAYCAERNGNFDIYTIPADGGEETRLTTEDALDDGPEYSPDGKYIWFNSTRTGLMQVWRMEANGKNPEQMTFSLDKNSWFPHVSPNGKNVVFISYKKEDVKPDDHPFGKDVELYLMPSEGGVAKSVIQLFGGQGTINVNSWSPDSKRFAFISYERER
jgi:Tol biopolymer transport system component